MTLDPRISRLAGGCGGGLATAARIAAVAALAAVGVALQGYVLVEVVARPLGQALSALDPARAPPGPAPVPERARSIPGEQAEVRQARETLAAGGRAR